MKALFPIPPTRTVCPVVLLANGKVVGSVNPGSPPLVEPAPDANEFIREWGVPLLDPEAFGEQVRAQRARRQAERLAEIHLAYTSEPRP